MPTLLVDTREQKPYRFPGVNDVEHTKLPVGDYTYEGFKDTFAVERKTLDDLANSLGNDRLRFENEIRRVNGFAHRNEDGNPMPGTKPDYKLSEFVVVIEAHPKSVYKYSDRKYCPNYYSNIYPKSITSTLAQWPDKYEVLDFQWAGDRHSAKQETLRLLDKWYLDYND